MPRKRLRDALPSGNSRVLMSKALSRRDFTLLVSGATVALVACDAGAADDAGDKVDTDTGETGALDSGEDDSAETGDTSDTSAAPSWATGGTAALAASYPSPFTAATDCAVYCAMTLGPCYDETPVRQDISEGADGLPIRLTFRILNEACEPVPDALVEVWHTHPNGKYSGAEAIQGCTGGDAAAMAALWFRGGQSSDADGIVAFDTCLPGWYMNRAIHIHFQVIVGGQNYSISQLFFPQDLLDGIYTVEPVYKDRGAPDTPNAQDGIYAAADNPTDYELEWLKQSDGAMLAWKTIVIRSSLDQNQCFP